MTIRSVRTHHFVAERVAKDNSEIARCAREPVVKGQYGSLSFEPMGRYDRLRHEVSPAEGR
jgi:hypothetical protein